MLIVLAGPSCAGKSVVLQRLCDECGFRTVVPYTSREPRNGETDGIEYHFRSESEISELSSGFQRGYWNQPMGRHWYGYAEDLDRLAASAGDWAIQASTAQALAIRTRNPLAILVFLDTQRAEVLQTRQAARFFQDASELLRRSDYTEKERQQQQNFDHIVNSDSVEELFQAVVQIISSTRACRAH
jgi:guanylate kinase